MKSDPPLIAADCAEIVRRLVERNQPLRDQIRDGTVTLEQFASMIVLEWCAFNGIPPSDKAAAAKIAETTKK